MFKAKIIYGDPAIYPLLFILLQPIHNRKHFATADYFSTLYDCMDLFTAPNIYTQKQPWYCPNCEVHVEAVRRCTLWKLPEVLIIHLKRFTSAW